MKNRHIVAALVAVTGLGLWSGVCAQSPFSGIKGAGKVSNIVVKTDTVSPGSGVEAYVSNLPNHRVRPENIAPALVGLLQTFGVRDNEGSEYTRNDNDYFSLVPSVCYETAMGTLISGNVREPWRTDNEFMPHQGPYTAFLYESPRTVALFGNTSGKNYEQLDATPYLKPFGNPKWDLWVYDNGYAAPQGRYFDIDTTTGVKTGVMVWMVMPDGNSSPDSIRLVCADHKVTLTGPTDFMAAATEPELASGEIIIGGCFLIPRKDGPIPYVLAGIASRNNDKWYVYYPFAFSAEKETNKLQLPKEGDIQSNKEDTLKKELDTEKPVKKPEKKDDIDQIKKQQKSNNQNKKESEISGSK